MARRGTPKRSSFGRIRQERSGRWSAGYWHDGLLHRSPGTPTTFPNKRAAESWLEAERKLIDDGRWTPPSERAKKATDAALTLRAYSKPWLKNRNISRRTAENYGYHLERNILPVLGEKVLTDLTPEDVRVWFTGLGTQYQTRNARAYGVLTAVLNTAVDDGLLDRSPARIKGGTAVKHTKRSVVLLEPDELAALADKMPDELALTVLLAGWLGLRRGEVFALTRADVAADGSTVRINKGVTYREGVYVSGPPKTKESNRTVTVPTHLRPMLTDHLRDHVGPTKGALLFPDPVSGSFFTEGRYRGPFDAAKAAIGHDDLHVHDLRHFGGVMAALAGATTKEVMSRLGHTTSAASMRYQHVAVGRADALAERLSALAAEQPQHT